MWARRHIHAPLPGDRCRLEVSAVHPEMGPFFEARLTAARSAAAGRSETAGLTYLWRWVMLSTFAVWFSCQCFRCACVAFIEHTCVRALYSKAVGGHPRGSLAQSIVLMWGDALEAIVTCIWWTGGCGWQILKSCKDSS